MRTVVPWGQYSHLTVLRTVGHPDTPPSRGPPQTPWRRPSKPNATDPSAMKARHVRGSGCPLCLYSTPHHCNVQGAQRAIQQALASGAVNPGPGTRSGQAGLRSFFILKRAGIPTGPPFHKVQLVSEPLVRWPNGISRLGLIKYLPCLVLSYS